LFNFFLLGYTNIYFNFMKLLSSTTDTKKVIKEKLNYRDYLNLLFYISITIGVRA